MAETPVSVRHEHLEQFIVGVLMAMKMPRTPAEVTAGFMVRTDLRGVDSHGIGITTVRNSSHFGAAGNYSMLALEHDMIGLSTTNMPVPAAVPTFGRTAMFSTNPLSFAAPAGRGSSAATRATGSA